ncbi:MAG: hypothetical protein ACRBN8_16060 [Nannocystales bacterium]
MLTKLRFLSAACTLGMLACSSSPSSAPTVPGPDVVTADSPAATVPDDARGGRLYDKWFKETATDLDPGKAGGARGDGTLLNASGEVVDPSGHSYRLKNLFGWDMRGAEGIYGPDYQNKPYVLSKNLLEQTQSEEELLAWLRGGDEELPALAEVLEDDALRDLAAFIAKTQRGELPGPEKFFTLSAEAPKNYILVEGGDAAAGKPVYADACAGCHGEDGTSIPIDETLSLGAFMRTKAYEGWFKVVNGHPGSAMGREIEFSSADEAAATTLSILAALCDRGTYPPLDGQSDVADGDLRCGAYLR